MFITTPDTNYTLMGNNTVNLTCTVQAPPNTGLSVTIQWFFRGGTNLPHFVTVDTIDGMVINASSTLSISQAEPCSEGEYSCRAHIGSLDNQIVTNTTVFVQCKLLNTAYSGKFLLGDDILANFINHI